MPRLIPYQAQHILFFIFARHATQTPNSNSTTSRLYNVDIKASIFQVRVASLMSTKSSANLRSDIGTALVTLEVGPSKQKHVVHKDLLTAESPYFRAMFEGQWKESSLQQPAALPTANEHVFPRFLNWLYFRSVTLSMHSEICLACDGDCDWDRDLPDETSYELGTLTADEDAKLESLIATPIKHSPVHLYILADQFDVPALRKDIINGLWAKHAQGSRGLAYREIIACWRQLPSTSPLCRLLMGVLINTWVAKDDECCPVERKLRTKLPVQMLFELAAQLQVNKGTGKAIGRLCEYHEHPQTPSATYECKAYMRKRFEAAKSSYFDCAAIEEKYCGEDKLRERFERSISEEDAES